MKVFVNGKFLDAKKARVSVFDHGFMYGDGLFERLRTYGGQIWNSRAHLERMFEGARRLKIHIPWSIAQVERWVMQTMRKNKLAEAGIRIQISRGACSGDLRYDFSTPRMPTIVIMAVKPKCWPKEFFTRGIPLSAFNGERPYPEVKTTSLLSHVMALHDMATKNAKEAIFVDHRGFVHEGTSCNIFFIKNNTLIVPDARVLGGTTAAAVVNLARELRIPVRRKSVKKTEIYGMDEAFITSVTRGIMPVSQVDGKYFKQKSPGEVTVKLRKKFIEMATKFANGAKVIF